MALAIWFTSPEPPHRRGLAFIVDRHKDGKRWRVYERRRRGKIMDWFPFALPGGLAIFPSAKSAAETVIRDHAFPQLFTIEEVAIGRP